MKRIFRRNQVIITTLAVMIAAAGYLNYSAKKEVAGSEVYEAGMMEISDEDILAENQAQPMADDGTLKEIASLDSDTEGEVSAVPEAGETVSSENAAPTEVADNGAAVKRQKKPVWKIPARLSSQAAPAFPST